ncbi:MAG: hypothetical protein H6751_05005 [Candidatus Omnitrophica bacterium]|nr:hypothetical protein [Candidatus Omnitrophota bacterium]
MINNLHPDLQSWLETATENLASEGKARVVEMVLKEYERHIDQVGSEEEALRATLAELGEAVVAGKNYRERFLTVEESRVFEPVTLANFFRGLLNECKSASSSSWTIEHGLICLLFALLSVPILYVTPLSNLIWLIKGTAWFVLLGLAILLLSGAFGILIYCIFQHWINRTLRKPLNENSIKRIIALRMCRWSSFALVLILSTTWLSHDPIDRLGSMAIMATAMTPFFWKWSITPVRTAYKKLNREVETL